MEELRSIMEEAFHLALKRASLEAFEGQYPEKDLAAMVNKSAILDEAVRSAMAGGEALNG